MNLGYRLKEWCSEINWTQDVWLGIQLVVVLKLQLQQQLELVQILHPQFRKEWVGLQLN